MNEIEVLKQRVEALEHLFAQQMAHLGTENEMLREVIDWEIKNEYWGPDLLIDLTETCYRPTPMNPTTTRGN